MADLLANIPDTRAFEDGSRLKLEIQIGEFRRDAELLREAADALETKLSMTDSPFVLRMCALHQAREQAQSLSEKIRLDGEMAELLAAHHRGDAIEPVEEPADFKQAQANDGE